MNRNIKSGTVDGCTGNSTGIEALERERRTATVFLTSDFCGWQAFWSQYLQCLWGKGLRHQNVPETVSSSLLSTESDSRR